MSRPDILHSPGVADNCGPNLCSMANQTLNPGVTELDSELLVSQYIANLTGTEGAVSEEAARRFARREGFSLEQIIAAKGCAATIVNGDCPRFYTLRRSNSVLSLLEKEEPNN